MLSRSNTPEYHRNLKARLKARCVAYLFGACWTCGLKHECLALYEFHHKDPAEKEYTIARSWKKFEAHVPELLKCELLCANCHRIKHWRRRA